MRRWRLALGAILVATLIAGSVNVVVATSPRHLRITADFANSTGLYPGDQIRVLGVPVGQVDRIVAVGDQVAVTFSVDRKYRIPADAQAAILSPGVVSARVIQLVPPYTGGPTMTDGAIIPRERTAVPVEWDELREQLSKLVDAQQPVTPGGVSPLGALVNTAADNARGEGANIRQSVLELSQTLSALGDHSEDVFGTVEHLSALVTALHGSADVLAQLNRNLANVSGLLANQPGEVGDAVTDLDVAIKDVAGFIADNRAAIGDTSDKLASLTTAVASSMGDLKQALHVTPNALANFQNMYRPATGGVTGVFDIPNFANPLQFICGAIQAASRKNYEQSAKLCAQYLAPIFKNRAYNFQPFGTTLGMAGLPVTGAMARPNEITYSEDRLRPDYNYRPDRTESPAPTAPPPTAPPGVDVLPAEQPPVATDPTAGLPGLMLPQNSSGS